jgi:peptidoglycan/xylan/chitin deacetylase (PgdA/CDA1 family)
MRRGERTVFIPSIGPEGWGVAGRRAILRASRCTVNINLAVLEHFPEIRDAMLARDWDFCFHGFYNDLPEPRGLSESEERAWYERAIEMFYDLTGRRMTGANVLSRGSHYMPDLLAELGFLYHADWMHDDQPTPIKVRRGRLRVRAVLPGAQ